MLEATDAGLREGVFFETLLGDPPLVDDVRRATVRNLAAQYDTDFAHAEHVARLALELWDALAAAGLHRGDPKERELLWATAMLHDIGTAVDYDDHHKHSRYLILNAGLPGFSPREVALIGQAARYHRKGNPGPRRVLRARARRRRGRCSTGSPPPSGSPSSSSAHATRPSTPATSHVAQRHASSCACTPTRTSRSPAGRPSVRATCSARRSGASSSVS